jgi:hypothetical protein
MDRKFWLKIPYKPNFDMSEASTHLGNSSTQTMKYGMQKSCLQFICDFIIAVTDHTFGNTGIIHQDK